MRIFWIAVAATATLGLNAQTARHGWCGQESMTDELLQRMPDIEARVRQDAARFATPETTSEALRIIPVVVHILHEGGIENISDARVEGAIEQLNRDFRAQNADTSGVRALFKPLIADMEIEFRLAKRDPSGRCTNGIVRHFTDATDAGGDSRIKEFRWPTNRYLNIYVVKKIKNSGGGTILGYAYLPHMAANQSHDGVVIISSEMNAFSRTLTHEVGHYLGLWHTFQNGCNSTNDGVDDTPPTQGADFDCNFSQNTCSNDNPDLPDMIENFMDYSSCPRMFTAGQKARVNTMFGLYRSNLSSTSNLQATGVAGTFSCQPVPEFEPSHRYLRAGGSVSFQNLSQYEGTVTFSWNFPGGTPSTSSDESPTVTYSTEGLYDVSLTVSQGNFTETKTHSKLIAVIPANPWITQPWIEPISNAMPEWMFPRNEFGHHWEVTTAAAFSPPASVFFNNYEYGRRNEIVELILPPVDMTTLDEPVLKFKYAYAQRDASDKDLLAVYVSTNGGASWAPRWFRYGHQMLTVGGAHPTPFYPQSPAQWDSAEVNLAPYRSNTNLLIRFTFRSGMQNNVFLDDIQLGRNAVWSGLGKDGAGPRPTVRVVGDVVEAVNYRRPPQMEVYAADGRCVARRVTSRLDLAAYRRGAYWIRVVDRDGGISVLPFIKR